MKISIITATFNSEKTIQSTIDSILAQKHKDIEWIVVDGKSTDKTMEIVNSNVSRFYRGGVQIISEKDNGLYDAMNKGIRMASGDVVGILNSDDFYTADDVLETIDTAFLGSDCDAVYGDVHYVQESDLSRCVRYYSSKVFSREKMCMGFMPAHPSFYCKKTIYQKYGLFDTSYKIAADFEQLLRLIYVEEIRTKYIEKDFVTMRLGGASTSGFRSRKQIMKEQIKAFKKNNVRTNVFLLSLRYIYKLTEYVRHK
jgi:glycosyltransferase involved in cell wall biosynthesis